MRNSSRKGLVKRPRSASVVSQQALKRSWASPESRRVYLESVAKGDVTNLYTIDWYQLTKDAPGLLRVYGGSPANICMYEFPEIAWLPWKFRLPPKGWWQDLSYRFLNGDPVAETTARLYLEELESTTSLEESRLFKTKRSSHGVRLAYLGGLSHARRFLYGEAEQRPSVDTLAVVPDSASNRNQWKSFENRRALILDLQKKLGGTFDSLHKLEPSHFLINGARPILTMFMDSIFEVVAYHIPEHCWRPWRFGAVPKNYWKELRLLVSADNVHAIAVLRDFIEDLGHEYGVAEENLADWYHVELTRADKRILSELGGLQWILRVLHPDHKWNTARLRKISSVTAQSKLKRLAVQLL